MRGTAAAQRFRDTVLPHLDAAYNFARYLTRDPTAAEDIVQEAFLRAFRAISRLPRRRPAAWLFAIVRNCFYAWLPGSGAARCRASRCRTQATRSPRPGRSRTRRRTTRRRR